MRAISNTWGRAISRTYASIEAVPPLATACVPATHRLRLSRCASAPPDSHLNTLHRLYVTVPAGAADLAAAELESFGASDTKASRGGVACAGTLEHAYRACLWSRVANRVLLPMAEFPAATPEALYDGARGVDWSAHLGADGTLAVDCTSSRSAITHTQFAALKVKDAIVDRFRDETGTRPSIDVAAPDVQVNLHIDRDVATLAIDLSGESLHRRGYRGPQGAAPLKENLAAAILLRAGWPALVAAASADGEPLGFVDPMCGSGTLCIEAASIAADAAPGFGREYFGFLALARSRCRVVAPLARRSA